MGEETYEELEQSLKYAEDRLRGAEWEKNHWENIVNAIRLALAENAQKRNSPHA